MQSMEVAITAEQGKVAVRPQGYLGDAFTSYRDACARGGAKWHAASKSNIAKASNVVALKQALESAGFVVAVDRSILEAVQAERQATTSKVDAAKIRLEAANRAIRERFAAEGKEYVERSYQAQGVLFLAGRLAAMLCDDMGLGKTLQALLALPEDCACVWVCPRSLKLNVVDEAAMWRPDLKVSVLEGRGSFRYPERGEVVVLNYDILPGELEEIEKANGKTEKRFKAGSIAPAPVEIHLVADECHKVKSSKTTRTKLLRGLCAEVRKVNGSTWGMTGTEMPNRPLELWTLLETFDCARESFGDFGRFMYLFGGYRGSFGIDWDQDKIQTEEVVKCLRRVSLKRMKRDVLPELPPKTFKTIHVEIDEETKLFCDRVVAIAEGLGINLDEVDDVVKLTRIKGADFSLVSKAMAALATAKMSAALDVIESYEEAGEPLVVFSAYRAAIDALEKRDGWAVIHGDTPDAERRQAKMDFQAGLKKGIAGTISAMGVGHTFTRAWNVLQIDMAWTPSDNDQAYDRVCRIGQKSDKIIITKIVARHRLDINLDRILSKKRDLQDATINAAAVMPGEEIAVPSMDDLTSIVVDVKPPEPRPVKQNQSWRTIQGHKVPVPSSPSPHGRRDPRTPIEKWVAAGLARLAGSDPDRAGEINGVGFSKFDGDFGHKLADRVQWGLTDREWEAAIRLCRKYRRQIGEAP